jgi:hypothetical protein
MSSSGMLRRAILVRTDVSEERIASIVKATRIGELGTTLASTSNDIVFLRSVLRLILTANVVPSSLILVTLRMTERYVPAKRRFLQEPLGVTFQKTAIFSKPLMYWHPKAPYCVYVVATHISTRSRGSYWAAGFRRLQFRIPSGSDPAVIFTRSVILQMSIIFRNMLQS